jgi:hypothetical protein
VLVTCGEDGHDEARRGRVYVTHGCGPGYPERKAVVLRPCTAAVEVEREPEVVGTFTGRIVVLAGRMARSWRDIPHDDLVVACMKDGRPGTGIRCQFEVEFILIVFTSFVEKGQRGLSAPLRS